MSSWQGANVRKRSREEEEEEEENQNVETVEATLNRFSNSYAKAMQTLAKAQKVEVRRQREDHEGTQSTLATSVVELSKRARAIFQQELLVDPLISKHTPSLSALLETLANEDQEEWGSYSDEHRTTLSPKLVSASHQNTVKELAYLTLLNYADLLVQGNRSMAPGNSSSSILDRGLVVPFQQRAWKASTETVLRVAFMSLVDASALVGDENSDPVFWLKLACIARQYGRTKSSSALPSGLLPYRRIEIHALREADHSVPSALPRNRLVQRALKEWEDEFHNIDEYPSVLEKPQPLKTISLSVPRYSWLALGRSLLRLCRENHTFPLVLLHLSPMLMLPPKMLGLVCEFLDSKSVSQLEATCKALSVGIVSVRASRDHSTAVRRASLGARNVEAAEPANSLDKRDENPAKVSHRASKRLLTQQINSGKRQERNERRQSIEYCFFSAILGCSQTDSQFRELLERSRSTLEKNVPSSISPKRSFGMTRQLDHRVNESSLGVFIGSLGAQIPFGLIVSYLSHLSIDPSAFALEATGVDSLAHCTLDAFSLLAGVHHISSSFDSRWYCAEFYANTYQLSDLELFAMDLLQAELRLRKCEVEEVACVEIDGDADIVLGLTVSLRERFDSLSNSGEQERRQHGLVVRCLWFFACYKLWYAKVLGNDVSMTKRFQEESIEYINKALLAMKQSRLSTHGVPTPHLSSGKRRGQHWKKLDETTLSIYRDEVRASARIHEGQEKFFACLTGIECGDFDDLGGVHDEVLLSIGRDLLERYRTPFDSPEATHSGLLDDIFEIYRSELHAAVSRAEDCRLALFQSIIPMTNVSKASLQEYGKLSILGIIFVSLGKREEWTSGLASLLIGLIGRLSISTKGLLEYHARNTEVDDSDDSSHCSDSDSEKNDLQVKIMSHFLMLDCFVVKLESFLKGRDISLERETLEETRKAIDMVFELLQFTTSFVVFSDFSDCIKCLIRDLASCVDAIDAVVEVNRSDSPKVHFGRDCLRLFTMVCEYIRGETGPKVLTRLDLIFFLLSYLGPLVSSDDPGYLLRDLGVDTFDSKYDLVRTCDTSLWLWSQVLKKTSGEVSIVRAWQEKLKVPLASTLIALCGTKVGAFRPQIPGSGPESTGRFGDFFDSDDSACEWEADTDDEGLGENTLRAIGQAVSCISLIVETIDDEEGTLVLDSYPRGPLLPSIGIKVLTKLSEQLITRFQSDDIVEQRRKWRDYPIGTRGIGHLLDSVLGKMYRWSHGIPLPSGSDGKDSKPIERASVYAPEDFEASSHLYRYIMRVYSQGKKAPPRAALVAVRAALPPSEDVEIVHRIKNFIFGRDTEISLRDVSEIVFQTGDWEKHFKTFENWGSIRIRAENELRMSLDESILIRRGISSLLAQGPLHAYSDPQEEKYRREATENAEVELSQKFYAIIEETLLGEVDSAASWFKASQCLVAKADLIADRLPHWRDFLTTDSFVPDHPSTIPEPLVQLQELLSNQRTEYDTNGKHSTDTIGNNLSFYVSHSWSSHNALKRLGRSLLSSNELNSLSNDVGSVENTAIQEIELLRAKKSRAEWQAAWGGVFVSSIRKVAVKCLTLSLFSLKDETDPDSTALFKEIRESLGRLLYTTLQGGQKFGFPIRPLTKFEIRELATASLNCFGFSDDISISTEIQRQQLEGTDWDSAFLIGKCYEKIAGTYQEESFLSDHATNIPQTRRYEHFTACAFNAYAYSLQRAKGIENSGAVLAEGQGGSSHGSTEVLYRIHASRIKCVIRALRHQTTNLELAKAEAIRLTSHHRFRSPEETHKGESENITLSDILLDAIEGLQDCRKNHSFFHRSVYRHAQARLWLSAAGYMPTQEEGVDCPGKIDDLAKTEAFDIMHVLFEKRRPQLCSVWLTSSTYPSLIESTNTSCRKYDFLRGKYIGAYVQLLRLCEKKSEAENFVRWTSSSDRDYPGYFWVSALSKGSELPPHSVDSLLIKPRLRHLHFFHTCVKRETNGALAFILRKEFLKKEDQGENDKDEFLKASYACFLRLNCAPRDLKKDSRLTPSITDVVETFLLAFQKYDKGKTVVSQNSRGVEGQAFGMLEAAAIRCRSLFPSVSQSFITKKTTKRKRKEDLNEEKSSNLSSPDEEPQYVVKAFEVVVPVGMSAGQVFEASVPVNGVLKTFRLTVPEGKARTLRFNVKVPQEGTSLENSTHSIMRLRVVCAFLKYKIFFVVVFLEFDPGIQPAPHTTSNSGNTNKESVILITTSSLGYSITMDVGKLFGALTGGHLPHIEIHLDPPPNGVPLDHQPS